MFTESDIISRYTRADAIEDGVLADLSTLFPAETKIYRHPVACTESVWGTLESAVNAKQGDIKGLVSDLLWMSQKGHVKKLSESTFLFQVRLGRKNHIFKVTVGASDDMTPCVTIMGELED